LIKASCEALHANRGSVRLITVSHCRIHSQPRMPLCGNYASGTPPLRRGNFINASPYTQSPTRRSRHAIPHHPGSFGCNPYDLATPINAFLLETFFALWIKTYGLCLLPFITLRRTFHISTPVTESWRHPGLPTHCCPSLPIASAKPSPFALVQCIRT
jgi:hypothetical protein